MQSRESSTRKEKRVQGSLPSPYKMERLLRWLCSTQASDHLYSFSPLTLISCARAEGTKEGFVQEGETEPIFTLGHSFVCWTAPAKTI